MASTRIGRPLATAMRRTVPRSMARYLASAAARERVAAGTYDSPEEVNQAIEAERAYLASLVEQHVIQIGGDPPRGAQITGMMALVVQEALDITVSSPLSC